MQMSEEKYVMTDEPCETIDSKDLPKLDKHTRHSIRTEISTAVSLASVYFLFIFAVPAINWFKPDWAFSKMFGGMSYSWFLTTIVAMVMAFLIAYLHTKLYERWERNNLAAAQTAHKKEENRVEQEGMTDKKVEQLERKEETVL